MTTQNVARSRLIASQPHRNVQSIFICVGHYPGGRTRMVSQVTTRDGDARPRSLDEGSGAGA